MYLSYYAIIYSELFFTMLGVHIVGVGCIKAINNRKLHSFGKLYFTFLITHRNFYCIGFGRFEFELYEPRMVGLGKGNSVALGRVV